MQERAKKPNVGGRGTLCRGLRLTEGYLISHGGEELLVRFIKHPRYGIRIVFSGPLSFDIDRRRQYDDDLRVSRARRES